jgi:hypothetical protein
MTWKRNFSKIFINMKLDIFIFGMAFLTTNLFAQDCTLGDCQNGYGIKIFGAHVKYLGEFKNRKQNGQGVYFYGEDIKYVGSWENNARHGEGRMYINGNMTQSGIWDNNKLIQKQGNTGCISGNCEDGGGVYLYEDGRKLYGEFRNDKAKDKVICYYPNGNKYIGNWEKNKREGFGLFYNNGKEESGVWYNDIFLGITVTRSQEGCVLGNCLNGEGIFVYSDDTRYNGKFKDGLASGFGVCYYTDGDIYIGQWSDHNFHGEGTLYFHDGSLLEGLWKNGALHDNVIEQSAEVYYDYHSEQEPVQEQEKGKLWVVLVGVGRYPNMPDLKYTDGDAYELYSFFKSPIGGALPDNQIIILVDEEATRRQVLDKLTDFANKAGKNDMLIFFFSGHGISGSFLPHDYDKENVVLKHDEILNILEKSEARSKVVIADACHSGSFMEGGQSHEEFLDDYYGGFSDSEDRILLLLSSTAGESSVESNGLRQGVFSHFLISGLKGDADSNRDTNITIEEIYDYVYMNVRQFTRDRQTPVIRGNFDKKRAFGIPPRD